MILQNTNNFKSFKYKANLLENTVNPPSPNAANGILRTATIAVLLKYWSNFWRSFEILLISCKVELKLNWTKYCVLPAAGNEIDINPNKAGLFESSFFWGVNLTPPS